MNQNGEVQIEDKDVVIKDKKKDEVKFFSVEEISSALEHDPKFAAEFVADEEAFIKKYNIQEASPDGEKPSEDPPKDDGHKPEKKEEDKEEDKDKGVVDDGEDVDVTVTLKKSDLGTYMTGRSDSEAVIAAIKGKLEADKTINRYKEERLPELEGQVGTLSGENTRLKAELGALKAARPKKSGKPAPKATDFPKIDIPEMGDEDFVTEEGQAKLKQHVVAMKALDGQNRKMVEIIEELRGNMSDVQKKSWATERETTAKDKTVNEFDTIDRFTERNKDVLGDLPSMKEMEASYVDFLTGINNIAGVKDGLYAKDGSGKFSEETIAAYNIYNDKDSEAGKNMDTECEKRGIKLPEHFKALQTIYDIRGIRGTRGVRDATGTYNPIDYDEAFTLYQKENGQSVQDLLMKERLDAHNKHAQAVGNRENFAKETNANGGASPVDNFSTDDILKIAQKPIKNRTEIETDALRQNMKAGGIPEAEIKKLTTVT